MNWLPSGGRAPESDRADNKQQHPPGWQAQRQPRFAQALGHRQKGASDNFGDVCACVDDDGRDGCCHRFDAKVSSIGKAK